MDVVDFDLGDDELRRLGTAKWTMCPSTALPAWIAELDCRPSARVREAVDAAVARGAFGYAPTDEHTEVAAATAEFVGARFSWTIDPARVVTCGDVLSGVELVLRHLAEPAPVIVPTASYPPMLQIVPQAGHELVPIPTHQQGMHHTLDVDAIESALAAGARTILLISPHNPLGRCFTRDELIAVRDAANRHGARVVSDEIHAPLVLPGARHVPYASLPDTAHHVTTVIASSKAFNTPGLKCAQLVMGNDSDLERLRALPPVGNHGMSPLGIAAAIAAYREGTPWLDSLVAHIDRMRDLFDGLMQERLPHLPRTRPEATYLAWVDARPTGLADPAKAALDAGVMVNAGRDFGPGFEGFARINLGTSAERLERIVNRLAVAWG